MALSKVCKDNILFYSGLATGIAYGAMNTGSDNIAKISTITGAVAGINTRLMGYLFQPLVTIENSLRKRKIEKLSDVKGIAVDFGFAVFVAKIGVAMGNVIANTRSKGWDGLGMSLACNVMGYFTVTVLTQAIKSILKQFINTNEGEE